MNVKEKLLDTNAPVALVIKEKLRPVGGKGSVIFPPTYAPDKGEQKASGYNICETRKGKRCTIDSVGSQANRIEEVFMQGEYSSLVPKVTIKAGDKEINLLNATHRLADAAIRFSDMEDEINKTFEEFLKTGNATPIAKINPMSIVFGAWDSRGTHARLPRIFSSTIFAEDIEALTRKSIFIPTLTVSDVINESEEDLSETDKDKWSKVGLAHAPSTSPGGVIVHGEIIRESLINLIALRHLKGKDDEESGKLRKYILGLLLVCATLPQDYNLRSGCQLVRNGKEGLTAYVVCRDGTEEDFFLDHDQALETAKKEAMIFGIPQEREANFIPQKAKDSLKVKKKKA